MKRCPDCGEADINKFGKNRSTKDGLTSYCRLCHNARVHASRDANGGARRYHFRRRYGVEPEEFDALIKAQGNKCAICRKKDPTHMDHNHKTGRMRGALCVSCNNGLGLFRDSIKLLRAAADYLEEAA